MRHVHLEVLIVLTALVPLATDGGEPDPVIAKTARDFAEGAATGDAERVARSAYPGAQMLDISRLPNGREMLRFTTWSLLMESLAPGRGRSAEVPDVKVTVLDTYQNVSCVLIEQVGARGYAHIARINGEWNMVNAIRTTADAADVAQSDEDAALIEGAGLDYVDGFYAGSAEREVRGVHPSLHKVVVRQLPGGREFLHRIDRQTLEEAARAGLGNRPEAERQVSVRILHRTADAAAVAIPSVDFYDLAHVVKLNGEWRVVNVLWAPHER